MAEKTLSYEAEKLSKNSYSYVQPKSEYVLRVNNIKPTPTKANPNPENLPAIVKPSFLTKETKHIIILSLLFMSTFFVSTYVGYILIFKLFE